MSHCNIWMHEIVSVWIFIFDTRIYLISFSSYTGIHFRIELEVNTRLSQTVWCRFCSLFARQLVFYSLVKDFKNDIFFIIPPFSICTHKHRFGSQPRITILIHTPTQHTSQRKRQAAKMVFVERKINAPLFVFLFIDSVTTTTATATTKYAAKKDVENE